jgi:RNA polymerase primary sigma factor
MNHGIIKRKLMYDYLPPEALFREVIYTRLERMLPTLTPREEQIILLRYYSGREKPMTFREISEVFKVSKGRIQQIERKAIRKMKHPVRNKAIMSIMKPRNGNYDFS